jgi:hypothetical protein
MNIHSRGGIDGERLNINSLGMGYYNYIYGMENNLALYRYGDYNKPGGSLTISGDLDDENGINHLELVVNIINNDPYSFMRSYLFVGPSAGLSNCLITDIDRVTNTD